MENEKRVNEIISQITAFSKNSYTKNEFLPELFKLQQELVDLTFNGDHAENANLRLWDVENHFKEMNYERGYIADAELESFINSSKEICNTIKAEYSGNKGEKIVFRALEHLNCKNGILRNVELELDGRHSEIDTIVFTSRAIFIIEVKNSKKDIFIDENGNFYRTGNSMHYDGNIADKMNEREFLLRKALERTGIENPKIFKVVTFTNPQIDVENKYRYIKVCASNYLPTFIENFKSDCWYSYENICTMMEAVTEIKCMDSYKMSVNMDDYKVNFANLMAILEAADEIDIAEEVSDISNEKEAADNIIINNNSLDSDKHITYSLGKGIVAVAIGFTIINTAILGISKLIRK